MNRQPPAKLEASFWKSTRGAATTRKFANELFEGAATQVEAIDALIGQLSANWRVERMSEIDRAILRLGTYELRSGTAPVKVVINEAIELAKKFSNPESTAFLNGILDSASKYLENR